MPSKIVVDKSNLIGTDNNTFIYNFPSSVAFPNHEIALSSVDMYYAWFNISAALRNNTFSYEFPDAAGTGVDTFTVILEDGLYEIATINERLQYEFIQNGHYLIDSNAQYRYYINLSLNITRYSVQIDVFSLPASLPSGWTKPVGSTWSFPSVTAANPAILIAAEFNLIIGYAAGFDSGPAPLGGSPLSFLSTLSPNIQTNNILYVSVSNIDNKYGSPSGIVHTVTPNVGFGEQIRETPEFSFNKLHNGVYNSLTIQFLGTNKQPIRIEDPNTTITFIIKDKTQTIYA